MRHHLGKTTSFQPLINTILTYLALVNDILIMLIILNLVYCHITLNISPSTDINFSTSYNSTRTSLLNSVPLQMLTIQFCRHFQTYKQQAPSTIFPFQPLITLFTNTESRLKNQLREHYTHSSTIESQYTLPLNQIVSAFLPKFLNDIWM